MSNNHGPLGPDEGNTGEEFQELVDDLYDDDDDEEDGDDE